MMMLAMFQETYAFSSRDATLLMIFVGLVAFALVVQAIVVVVLGLKATKFIGETSAWVTVLKGKLHPLIESATELTAKAKEVVDDTAPKVKVITEHLVQTSGILVETSKVVRGSAQQFDRTITDANQKTQRQVARIDGMVSAALTTTSEIMENINHGIRVPAQKIAVVATQLRYGLEGLAAKVKGMAGGSPFGKNQG